MIYKYGKNDIGIDIFFDLLFTFLMRNVSGHAMLQDLTVMQIFSAILSQLFHFFGCIAEFQVPFNTQIYGVCVSMFSCFFQQCMTE